MSKLNNQRPHCAQTAVSSSVFLQIGMKVKILNTPRLYFFNSGKEKTITSDLENFVSLRAFWLDGDDGIGALKILNIVLITPITL